MSDITMCTQTLCPKAGSCYRRTARPGDWQSYAQFEYIIGPNGVVCGAYWPNSNMITTNSTALDSGAHNDR